MPTTIQLSTIPGKIERCRGYAVISVELFGECLGRETITIQRTADVAPAVRQFGERIRAAHPDKSFKISMLVRKGDRKPAGYDAARTRGEFGEDAFLHIVEKDSSTTVLAEAAQ